VGLPCIGKLVNKFSHNYRFSSIVLSNVISGNISLAANYGVSSSDRINEVSISITTRLHHLRADAFVTYVNKTLLRTDELS
jgi:hypothetical protein